MTKTVYWLHQNLTLITLILIVLRALIASVKLWSGRTVGGYKPISITANSVLDIQILLGIILLLFGIKPPASHLFMVAVAALLAHYSYSVEKRKGSSFTTVIAAWGAVVAVGVVFI